MLFKKEVTFEMQKLLNKSGIYSNRDRFVRAFLR